jgi:dephospho-CoA kinase
MTILIQGGIAAGKSTITRLLTERGAEHVDCDRIAHGVLEEPAVQQKIREAWGQGMLNSQGAVDRKALGRLVFSDPAALAQLEAWVHPRVRDLVRAALEAAGVTGATPRRVLVVDAAVADKMALTERYDLRLFVDVSLEERRRRAATRGWEPGELERREANQAPLEIKRERADAVLPNDTDLAEAARHVDRIWIELIEPQR